MKYKTLASVIKDMSLANIEEDVMHDRYMRAHGKKAQGSGMWAFTTKRMGNPSDNEMHIVTKNTTLTDAAKEAMKALNSKNIYVMEETQMVDIDEAVKTTHADPLVTVHDKDGLHTHANLSTVNKLFRTSVKSADIHKGTVNTQSGRADKAMLKIAKSPHHDKEVAKDKAKINEQQKLPTGVEMHYTHPDAKKKPFKSTHFSVSDAQRGQKEYEKMGYKLSHKKAVYAKEDMDLENAEAITEKKLTPAQMKKREEVAKAIERDQPTMAMDKKMAIATATGRKIAEEHYYLDENNRAHGDGFNDGQRGMRNPRASSIHGPNIDHYERGYAAGEQQAKQQKLQNVKKYKDSIAPYMKMSHQELKSTEDQIRSRHKKIIDTPHRDKTPAMSHEFKTLARRLEDIHQAKFQRDKMMKKEEVDLDELKMGTLARYATKAGKSGLSADIEAARKRDMGDSEGAAASRRKSEKRYAGQYQAINKINNRMKSGVSVAKEEVDLDEAFKKGDSVKITNARRYDALSKPTVSGTVIGMQGSKVMVQVGRGQMNVDVKDLMKESAELDEAKLPVAKIQKMVDDGKSMDVIVGTFANRPTTNTDEIRKVVKDYMWKKRMKKESAELDEARGGVDEPDKHIIMQLRSAQDLDGNKEIRFRGGKTAKVPKKHIDKILKLHDHPSMKPVNKRVMRVAISKSPLHLSRFADQIKENFVVEQMEPIFDYIMSNPSFELYEAPYKVPSNYTAMQYRKLSQSSRFSRKPDAGQQMSDKAKKDNMSQSDKDKLGKLSAMMKKEATDKEIKMAKGVAFDKRYKGGDYTGAAKTIEKIRKGLSDHPSVKSALRRANENVEAASMLDEKIKLKTKVTMHHPGKDYHGKTGHVGEIRHGAHSGAPKTYTIDYDNGKSVQLGKSNIKMHRE